MRTANPDMLLVGPWHFQVEFIKREKDYLNKGGVMLFSNPYMRLERTKKCALIIGVSGMIGQHLSDKLINNGYIVYGLARNKTTINLKVIFMEGDINDKNLMELMIKSIRPEEVYNLASPTNIKEANDNPIATFNTNIICLINICEILKSLNISTKLFNTNSIRMLQDNTNITMNEECLKFDPNSMYDISKLLAYWIIRYYREQFGLQFYNGFYVI